MRFFEAFQTVNTGGIDHPGEQIIINLDCVECFEPASKQTALVYMKSGMRHGIFMSYEDFRNLFSDQLLT